MSKREIKWGLCVLVMLSPIFIYELYYGLLLPKQEPKMWATLLCGIISGIGIVVADIFFERKDNEDAEERKKFLNNGMKRYFILIAIVVVLIAISCVILWNSESNAIYYILWEPTAVVFIAAKNGINKLNMESRSGGDWH